MTTFEPVRYGKYLLLDKIATGGMAELYRAKITGVQGFEKLIAIKKILPHLAQEEDLVECFIDEAKLAALLNHQNIVQIYDFGSLEGTYYIAMQYLFGKDLRRVLTQAEKKGIKIGVEYALYIVSRICSGLEYAHNLKDFQGKPLQLIHRDISPQNILISYEGDVKVVDFGIAKAAARSTLTQAGMIKGKVAYMSPEQAGGQTIDYRSDIFSVGILLYELITGRRMFQGETMEVLSKVREARYDQPETIVDLPDKIISVTHKALSKDPDQRYQSCGEMMTDLETCIHELSLWPTSSGLGRMMRALFEDEIAEEEKAIQRSSEVSVPVKDERPAERNVSAGDSPSEDLRPERVVQSAARKKTPLGVFVGAGVAVLIIIGLMVTFLPRGGDDSVQAPRETTEQASPQVGTNDTLETDRGEDMVAASETSAGSVNATPSSVIVDQPVKNMTEVDLAESDFQAEIQTELDDVEPPENAVDPLLEKARQASSEQRFADAVSAYRQAFTENSELSERFSDEYVAALRSLSLKVKDDDPEMARTLLIEAAETVPDSAQTQTQLGALLVSQGDMDAAAQAYSLAAELDPTSPNAFFNLGYVYARTKEFEKAEAMYARTVELDPGYLDEALSNLAIVQHLQGKHQESVHNLERALEINPDNELARRYLQRITAD